MVVGREGGLKSKEEQPHVKVEGICLLVDGCLRSHWLKAQVGILILEAGLAGCQSFKSFVSFSVVI